MQQAKEKFNNELLMEDALTVFCEVFGVNLINDLQQRNIELEEALRELTKLKESEVKVEKLAEKVKIAAKKKLAKKMKRTTSKAK
jgi:hypothetical protein